MLEKVVFQSTLKTQAGNKPISEWILKVVLRNTTPHFPRIFKSDWAADSHGVFEALHKAYWEYVDRFAYNRGHKWISEKRFYDLVFTTFPTMLPFGAGDTWQTKFGDYIRFRRSTPVAVAVIFDEDWRHCLLGRGFYSSQWQFPGGKVEHNETYTDCVIRELNEELSFDSSAQVCESLSVFTQSASRNVRAYFVETASTSVPFKPKTRYEIKTLAWFNIDELVDFLDGHVDGGRHKATSFTLIEPLLRSAKEFAALRRRNVPPLEALMTVHPTEISRKDE